MRAFVLLALFGCGGAAPARSGAPAPAEQVAIEQPTQKSDPCEGGEVTGQAIVAANEPTPPPARAASAVTAPAPSTQPAPGGAFASVTGMPPDDSASASAPEPEVSGDLDKAVIRRVVHTRTKQISACYEKALAANPGLEGKLQVKFTILKSGSVKEATTSGFDPKVGDCVGIEFLRMKFPKGPGVVTVAYPIIFKSTK